MEPPAEPLTPYAEEQLRTGRTFVLIAFVAFLVMTAVWVLVVSAAGLSIFFSGSLGGWGFLTVIIPFGAFLGLSLALAVWSWGILKDLDAGLLPKAEGATLTAGIIGVFPPLGAIVGGVFLLLAYWKVSAAVRYARKPPVTYGPSTMGARVCTQCGHWVVQGAKFCHQCGTELPT